MVTAFSDAECEERVYPVLSVEWMRGFPSGKVSCWFEIQNHCGRSLSTDHANAILEGAILISVLESVDVSRNQCQREETEESQEEDCNGPEKFEDIESVFKAVLCGHHRFAASA